MKYISLAVLALTYCCSSVEGTRINKQSVIGVGSVPESRPISLAQTSSQAKFEVTDGEISSTSVSQDLLNLAEYFGIDGTTTWMFSGETTKFSLWSFLNLISDKEDSISANLASTSSDVS